MAIAFSADRNIPKSHSLVGLDGYDYVCTYELRAVLIKKMLVVCIVFQFRVEKAVAFLC